MGDIYVILDEASSFFKNILQAKSVSGAVPLKEHGVYTVFVEFGNTKIEVYPNIIKYT